MSWATCLACFPVSVAEPTAGIVSLFGREIEQYWSAELQQIKAKKIGFIFRTFPLIDSLSALDYGEVVFCPNGLMRKNREEVWKQVRSWS